MTTPLGSPESTAWSDAPNAQLAKRRKVIAPPAPKTKYGTKAKDKKTALRAVIVNGTIGRDHVVNRATATDHIVDWNMKGIGKKQDELLSLMHDVQVKLRLFDEDSDRKIGRGSMALGHPTPENKSGQVSKRQAHSPEPSLAGLSSSRVDDDPPIGSTVASPSVPVLSDVDRLCSVVSKGLDQVQRSNLKSTRALEETVVEKSIDKGADKGQDCANASRLVSPQTEKRTHTGSDDSGSASDEANSMQQRLVSSKKRESRSERESSASREIRSILDGVCSESVHEKEDALNKITVLVKDNKVLNKKRAKINKAHDNLSSIYCTFNEYIAERSLEFDEAEAEFKIKEAKSLADQQAHLTSLFDAEKRVLREEQAEKLDRKDSRHRISLLWEKTRGELECEDKLQRQASIHGVEKSEIANSHESALHSLEEQHRAETHTQMEKLRLQLRAEYDNAAMEKERKHAEIVKGMEDDLTKAKSNSDTLQKRLQWTRNERNRFRTIRDEFKDANTTLTDSLGDKTSNLDTLNREMIRANAEILKLRTSSEGAWAEVGLLHTQVETQKLELENNDTLITYLQSTLNGLRTQSVIMESDMDTLKEKLSAVEAYSKTMRTERDRAAFDTDQACIKYAQASSRAEELAEIAKVRGETLAKIVTDKASIEAEATILRENVQASRSKIKSLTELSAAQGRELESSQRLHETSQGKALAVRARLEAMVGERARMLQAKRAAFKRKLLCMSWSQIVAHGECAPVFFNIISRFLSRHPDRGTAFQYYHGISRPGLLLHLPRRQELLVILGQANHTFAVWQQPLSLCSTFRHKWAQWLRMAPGDGRKIVYLRVVSDDNRKRKEWLSTHLAAQILPLTESETLVGSESFSRVGGESTSGKA